MHTQRERHTDLGFDPHAGEARASSGEVEPIDDSSEGERRRPRILLVTDRTPGADSGYGMRVDNVIEGLKQAGHLHVCLIDSSVGGESLPVDAGYTTTVIRARNPSKLHKLGLALTSLAQLPYRRPDELREAVARTIGSQEWDLVWFSRVRTYTACHGLISAAKVVVDFDDLNDRLVSSLVTDRTARRGRVRSAPQNVHGMLEVRRWSRLQRRIAREVDMVTVCSHADKAHLALTNCEVVRNGYRDPGTTVRTPDREHPTLLLVGPLSYEPNRLAAEWISFEVLPIVRRSVPAARVVLVGYDDGASRALRSAPGVTLTGWVHDIGAYYATASVAVAPLLSGGGTRLKVMEALARSVPLVSTSVGCFGLGLTSGEELLIADDAESFAAACVSVIEDQELADRLVTTGRARFEAEHTARRSSATVAGLATRLLPVAERPGRSATGGDTADEPPTGLGGPVATLLAVAGMSSAGWAWLDVESALRAFT
jgi:glycosyltransferase involved in cell wall biosynthesis